MTRFAPRLWVFGATVVCGSLGLLATTPAPSRSDDRTADVILAEIDAVQEPALDAAKQKNRAYVQQTTRRRKDAAAQKAKLIAELYRVDPANPRLVELLPERWRTRYGQLTGTASARELTGELDEAIDRIESDELKKEATYWKARIGMVTARGDAAKVKAVDEFIALDPGDARGAELLASLVSRNLVSPEARQALSRRLAEQYRDSTSTRADSDAGAGKGLLAMNTAKEPPGEAVGKPFDLEFYDASTGTPVSTRRLKGKVLVIDFWATWCGPCVAEMPRMKSLYADFRTRGVQFIGVSLDQGGSGLDKLQAFVAENGISWPQYYQGNGWDSEFSKSWGIRAIPTVFVVDQEGKVYSDKARGKLETILPELLKRSPATRTGTGTGTGTRGG
jgi:thiol-disulfide isomerase/thioredoxin